MNEPNWADKPLPVPRPSRGHGGNHRIRQADQEMPECARPGCTERVAALHRKYHSNECRTAAQPKRQSDPANWEERTCACGEVFSVRRLSTQKYHTEQCSRLYRRSTSATMVIEIDDKRIPLDSTYEILFFACATLAGVEIERFDERTPIQWSDSIRSNYDPDFWLPQYQALIEVKGRPRTNMHTQWAAARGAGYHLVVYGKSDILTLSPASFRQGLLERLAK